MTVRGVPVNRIRHVGVPGDNRELEISTRTTALDRLNADTMGERHVLVEATSLDRLATVRVVDFDHLD